MKDDERDDDERDDDERDDDARDDERDDERDDDARDDDEREHDERDDDAREHDERDELEASDTEAPTPAERGPAARSFDASYHVGAGEPRVGPVMRGMSMVLLVLVGACIGGSIVKWVLDALAPEPDAPAEVVEVRPTTDVITAVRDLARLESSSYHVERVIDLSSRQRQLFGLIEATDSILLIAAADVVAGVDLSELRDGDIVIDREGRRATVTLPPVRILSARLDNDRTYVYERETDALARRREDLETRARREAERTLEQAAIQGGILERGERTAAQTVESLVRSLGFDRVEVRFRTAEE